MLGAENGCFPSDGRVTRTMNALLAILSDAQLADGLKSFDDPDQVLLGRCFWPVTQPGERRSILVIANCDQRFQSSHGFRC